MSETILSHERLIEVLPTWFGQSFAFDTESTGLDPRTDRMLGVSLCFEDERSYYIVFEHTKERWDGSTYVETYVDRQAGLDSLRALFAQPDVVMVAHNMKHDLHFMANAGIVILGRVFDTLLAAQLLDENRSNGLKSLAPLVGIEYDKYQELQKYTEYSKDEILGVPLGDTAQYAIYDAEATWKLYLRFKEEMVGQPFESMFYDVWMPTMLTLREMEDAGISIDLPQVAKLVEEHEKVTNELEVSIRREGLRMIAGMEPEQIPDLYLEKASQDILDRMYEDDDGYSRVDIDGVDLPVITHDMKGKTSRWAPRVPTFNTGSDRQIMDLIFTHYNISEDFPVYLKRTKGGELSVDKDNLATIAYFLGDEAPLVIKQILEWRKSDKFLSTYLRVLLTKVDENGKIHTSFNQAVSDHGTGGTATGRLSSNTPNLQNIPSRGAIGEEARKLFIAEDGHELIVADYSNLELRILGHYSKDKQIIQAFAEGYDLHSLTAAGQNNIDYQTFVDEYNNENPEYKAMRMIGKTSNFALTYGMGPKKFQRYLLVNNKQYVEVDEAARLIAQFDETYAGAAEWKRKAIQYARRLGYAKTIGGRLRRLPDLNSRDRYLAMRAERQAINACIQGSASDIILEAMTPLNQMLNTIGGRLLLQVHDEVVTQVPKDVVHIAIPVIENLLVGFANPKLVIPLVVEAHAAASWGLAKG